jgi:hypothetical protein
MFKLAMEDPEFAKRLTNLKTPEQGAQMRGMMEKRGISLLPYLLGKTATTTAQGVERDLTMEGKQQVPVEGMSPDLPVVPRETARGMLDRVSRPLPPAPATRGLPQNNPAFPAAPLPAQRGAGAQGGQAQSMYAAMFPNDPISTLIQQRQAAMPPQGPAQ